MTKCAGLFHCTEINLGSLGFCFLRDPGALADQKGGVHLAID